MAHHLVDARAHTLGKALIVETCRHCIVLAAVLHAYIVDFLRAHALMYLACHSIEAASVDTAGNAYSLYLLGGLHHVACGHQLAFFLKLHDVQVHLGGLLAA
jgi:hypothetical protein